MSVYISPGNIKVKCQIFSTRTGDTCKKGLECAKYCYAKKAERQYPNVRKRRKLNYEESLKVGFTSEVVSKIRNNKKKIFRIHEAGDFYSKKYARKWFKIAKELPEHTFYSFTKRDDVFDRKLLTNKPNNLILIWSVDGIHKSKDDVSGEISSKLLSGFDKVSVVVDGEGTCPAIKDTNIKCQKDCRRCSDINSEKVIELGKH